MIVGRVDIDTKELIKHSNTPEEFIQYAAGLVPSSFRHLESVVNNQCYYCCLLYRRLDKIPWSKKNELLASVMPRIRVTGYSDCLIEAEDFIDCGNKKRIERFRVKGR